MIYCKRLNGRDGPAAPASISHYSRGNNYYVQLKTNDGINLIIGAGAYELLAAFKPLIRSMEKSILGEQGPAILRGEAPDNDDVRYVNLEDRGRDYGMLIMSREFLDLSVKDKLALLIKRFQNPPDGRAVNRDLVEALLDDYKAWSGKAYKSAEAEDSPQTQTQLVLAQYAIDELINPDGSIIYGAKTRIAEVIGVPVAGQSNIAKIDAVLEEIEKLANSTTSIDRSAAA